MTNPANLKSINAAAAAPLPLPPSVQPLPVPPALIDAMREGVPPKDWVDTENALRDRFNELAEFSLRDAQRWAEDEAEAMRQHVAKIKSEALTGLIKKAAIGLVATLAAKYLLAMDLIGTLCRQILSFFFRR
jgi:hypothetical protein